MSDLLRTPRAQSITATDPQFERAWAEYGLQTAVMQAQQAKAFYGTQLVIQLYRETKITVKEAIDIMVKIDPTTEYGPPYDEMFRQFNVDLMADLYDIVMKALRLGAGGILREIDRTLYLPPVPPTQPGLFTRILIGITGEAQR